MTPGTLTAPPPTRPAAAPAREPRPVPVPTPEPKRGGLLLPTTGGAVGVRAYPISRELYREMCEAGLLRREDRVQLIDGQLWEYPMMGHAHWLVLNSLFPLLLRTLPPGWFTTVQSPVVTDDYGEPEPDLAVVRGAISDYARKPTPEEAVVLIEISDSSLAFDRGRKLRAYAAAGVSEYWILNLNDRSVEIRRGPRPGGGETPAGYDTLVTHRGDDVVPLVLDGVTVREFGVGELMPVREGGGDEV